MFFIPESCPLKHDPYSALVMPRPVGWISSLSQSGVRNLAPFALFNLVSYKPPYVMFAPTAQVKKLSSRDGHELKDTLNNVQKTKQFVVNMATWNLRESVWLSSVPAPPDIDEFEVTGLTPIASEIVAPPRVKESPVHLECIYTQTIKLPHEDSKLANHIVLGKIVGVHIDDSVIINGIVDEMKLEPMARLGYLNYTRLTEIHSKPFPIWSNDDDMNNIISKKMKKN